MVIDYRKGLYIHDRWGGARPQKSERRPWHVIQICEPEAERLAAESKSNMNEQIAQVEKYPPCNSPLKNKPWILYTEKKQSMFSILNQDINTLIIATPSNSPGISVGLSLQELA